jgi:hypothetical protein
MSAASIIIQFWQSPKKAPENTLALNGKGSLNKSWLN